MDQYKWNMELHNWFMERREWIMQLKNSQIYSSILYIWFMEFHNYTRSSMNNHGVPWLIMEFHNWNYMSSIDN